MHAHALRNRAATEADGKEFLSAAMDSELDDAELGRLFPLAEQPGRREDWQNWHLIGDTLRGNACGSRLAARVALQLADEPTVLAPRRRPAARWVLPMAASVAAVALVGWSALHLQATSSTAPATLAASAPAQNRQQVAMASPPVKASGIDRARLAGYLASHRDFAAGANSPLMDATWQVPAEPRQ